MTVPIKKELGLMLISGVLLTVIHPPLHLWFLGWIAWVPFMLACREDISTRRLLLCGYLAGFCFWFGNMYWLIIVTLPGYIAFSFVYACFWPLLALSVRYVRRKKIPLFLAAPVIFVGAEAVQGWLFTGFSWYHLAHSQYHLLKLIQICDIFGALGVSVLIAMVNGLTVDWIHFKKTAATVNERENPERSGFRNRLKPFTTVGAQTLIGTVATVALIAGSIWYGNLRLAETPEYQTEGPILGSVQPNVPAWVKEEMSSGQKILDDLIADSSKCFEAGAVMVCWPETMVLAPMNPDYLAVCVPNSNPPRFQKQILDHAKDQGYVLFGAHTNTIGIENLQYSITNQYNSAYLYRPDGTPDPKIYHKIHLVPFGEYIPMKKSAPIIYRFFELFNPYDYDYSLTPGTDYIIHEIETEDQKYRFGTLICYEDTDPTVTRKLVLDEDGNKRADWLVNISNDGWYVHFKERQVVPMVELAQRTAISVFRCVENRTSIIRSVNTGISCLIEPTGKIRSSYQSGNLPTKAMDRQGVAGWFVDSIPLDSRVTFFSKHGRRLDFVLGLGWSIILLLSIYNLRKKFLTKKETNAKKTT